MYQARILDKNRQIKAILPGILWSYSRRINEATKVTFYIPREVIDKHITQGHALYGFFAPTQPFLVQGAPVRERENKTKYAEIAHFIQVYKGEHLVASGRIKSRTLGEVVLIEAHTEEILLESNRTPAQYGKVWDGWDLADVARDLLDGWQSIRVKAQSQWQDRIVASSNVDLTTNPGHVMLAKRSNGRYYDNGYITLLFNKSEIPNFKAWDRVRRSADSEDPVKTSIQISTNGTSFSTAFDGGFPEEIGYYIGGDHEQVWVRVNLSTTDTESEDENGNKVGVTPTVFAVEVIARTEGSLVAGNIPSVAGVTVKGLSADHTSAFSVLSEACEQVGWEFNVWDGALNLAESLGVDRTKDFVFRAGTNIEIQTLGDGDDELVNILTAYGPGQGINRMEITLRDETSVAQFGEYPLAMEFDAETLEELEQKAQEFLSEHNSPKTQFEITVAFDHGKEPDYGLGDKVRVADPETGIVTTTRIMAESREYGENGLVVNLELGKADSILSEVLSGDKKPTKPLDPLQPTGVYARGIVRGIRVGFSRPKGDWDTTEVHASTASGFVPSGGTLKDAGKQTQFDILDLEAGTRYYVRIVNVDNEGRKSEPSREVSAVPITMQEEQLKDYTDGVDDYVESISPVLLVSELPTLPDPRYPVGTIVFLITDEKLYRNAGGNWVTLVSMNLADLEGKLQSNQIELGAIQEDLIAAGAITETKIADRAIDTPKLAAGAVTAGKIAARTITAYEIATGAITSNEIAARTIRAAEIAVGAITADEIAAGAITAGKIAAGAISADKIKAGEISYDKLNVAFAKVPPGYTIHRHTAVDRDDYNVLYLPFSSPWAQGSNVYEYSVWHNNLGVLTGNIIGAWSIDDIRYPTVSGSDGDIVSFYNEMQAQSINSEDYSKSVSIDYGHTFISTNGFRLRVHVYKTQGTVSGLYFRFKRHSIA